MKKIVECVPNISEGKDQRKIDAIAGTVERKGVKLLDVSSDKNHNRSVITFAGEPEAVRRASYRLILESRRLIDMSKHKGAHPRMGAVDVCPFVPIAGISMDECAKLAWRLGKALWARGITGYYYGDAAVSKERVSLAYLRRGEYEALREKLERKEWKPDFGPDEFNPGFGAIVVGARRPLIAYNVNLDNASLELADNIARIIRGSGGIRTIAGEKKRIAGIFPDVQALGIDKKSEGFVQISMNIHDYEDVPLLLVFETVKRIASLCNVDIRESEIVGLVPRAALAETPLAYLQLKKFDPQKQIIEEALGL